MRLLTWALFIVLLHSPQTLHAQPDPTIADMLKAGKETGKPVLLEFYTTWCPPCRTLENEIFPDTEVRARLSQFAFTRFDSDTTTGWTEHRKLGVRMWPTFVAFDPRGREIDRHLGAFADAKDFLAYLDSLQKLAQLESTPTDPPGSLSLALERASKRGETKIAEQEFKKIEVLPQKDAALLAKGLFSLAELHLGQWNYSRANGLFERLLENYPDSPEAVNAAYLLEISYRRESLERVLKIYDRMIARHPQKVSWYAAYADLCAVNRYRLADGFRMAQKGLLLEPNNASLHATLAKLYRTKEDFPAAVETMRKAAALKPKSKEYLRTLTLYEAALSATSTHSP